jgi:hypothetical protein
VIQVPSAPKALRAFKDPKVIRVTPDQPVLRGHEVRLVFPD